MTVLARLEKNFIIDFEGLGSYNPDECTHVHIFFKIFLLWLDTLTYISSVWEGLGGSPSTFPADDVRPRTNGSGGPETGSERFTDRLSSGVAPSKPVSSGVSIGSWRMAVPSRSPHWPTSMGGDKESDCTVGTCESSAVGWEMEGFVRMFLEITTKMENYIIITYYNTGK